MYYAGFVFPNSFAMVHNGFGRTFTLQESPPPREAFVLRWYGRNAGGTKWDDERGFARYQNVPPPIQNRDEKPAAFREQYDRYDRINPLWTEGDALVVLARGDGAAVVSMLRRSWARAIKRPPVVLSADGAGEEVLRHPPNGVDRGWDHAGPHDGL